MELVDDADAEMLDVAEPLGVSLDVAELLGVGKKEPELLEVEEPLGVLELVAVELTV